MSIIKRTEIRDAVKKILEHKEFNHEYYNDKGEIGLTDEEIDEAENFSWLAEEYVEPRQVYVTIIKTDEGSYFNDKPTDSEDIEVIESELDEGEDYTSIVDNPEESFTDLPEEEATEMEILDIETRKFERESSGLIFSNLEKHVLVGAAIHNILSGRIENLESEVDYLESTLNELRTRVTSLEVGDTDE